MLDVPSQEMVGLNRYPKYDLTVKFNYIGNKVRWYRFLGT